MFVKKRSSKLPRSPRWALSNSPAKCNVDQVKIEGQACTHMRTDGAVIREGSLAVMKPLTINPPLPLCPPQHFSIFLLIPLVFRINAQCQHSHQPHSQQMQTAVFSTNAQTKPLHAPCPPANGRQTRLVTCRRTRQTSQTFLLRCFTETKSWLTGEQILKQRPDSLL